MNFITKKLSWSTLGLIAFLFVGINPALKAQETTKKSKKVVIITKKIDKDGKEIVEKIVREGAEIDDAEIDELIAKAKKEGGEIDISIEKEQRKVIKLDGEELHEEHILIEERKEGEKGEDIEVTVTVDEDGNTTRIEKRVVKQKKQAEEMEVTVSVDENGNTKIVKKRKKVADVEAKLEKMGITLPVLGKPVANYVHAVTSNNWVFLAGKGPRKADGKNIVGKLGKDLTVEQGYEAAKWAGINLLAALKGEIGDLNRVTRIVKVKGMVNAIPEFTDHSKVINGFSDLMVEVFGEKGKHARAAVGMSSLPGNMAVEIEVVVEIE